MGYNEQLDGAKGGPSLLAEHSASVLVFGASYCPGCTRLRRRLKGLDLPEGQRGQGGTWRYVDTEVAGEGGEQLFFAAFANAPFLPPLPAVVVISTSGQVT